MASEAPKLKSIRPDVSEVLVDTLKDWLAQAERGELTGALLLGNLRGDEVQTSWSGAMPFDRALFAFERWKFRNIEK